MPNLVDITNGVKPTVLNPEFLSRCDGLYEVAHCQAADVRQKETNHSVFFELLPRDFNPSQKILTGCFTSQIL